MLASLLDRWTMGHKLALIAAMALLMLLIPSTLYLRHALGTWSQGEASLQGLAPAEQLLELTRLSAQHRGLSSGALNGNAQAEVDRTQVQQRIEAQWAATRDALAVLSQPPLAESLQAIQAEFQGLSQAVAQRQVPPPVSFQRHNALIARQLDLIYEVAVASQIVLHPDPGGYFLQDAALNHLPMVGELLGQLRGAGMGILARGSITSDQRAQVAGLLERLRASRKGP